MSGTEADQSTGPAEQPAVRRKLLCIDMDGCLHSYVSGWTRVDDLPDPPVPGSLEFLIKASEDFDLAIHSSRSVDSDGMAAMQEWLRRWMFDAGYWSSSLMRDVSEAVRDDVLGKIQWPTAKPPAFLTIDDRAVTFTGLWPDPAMLLRFKTWQQNPAGAVMALGRREDVGIGTDVHGALSALAEMAAKIEHGRVVAMVVVGVERGRMIGQFGLTGFSFERDGALPRMAKRTFARALIEGGRSIQLEAEKAAGHG
jgi:hypothetical protein